MNHQKKKKKKDKLTTQWAKAILIFWHPFLPAEPTREQKILKSFGYKIESNQEILNSVCFNSES